MSEFDAGWNAALDEALRIHLKHVAAHEEFAKSLSDSRPDAPKQIDHYIANDLKALTKKVERLKR